MQRDPQKLVKVAGELTSVATEGIIAATQEVFDYDSSLYQSEINSNFYNASQHSREITEVTRTDRTVVYEGNVTSDFADASILSDNTAVTVTRTATSTGQTSDSSVDSSVRNYDASTDHTTVVWTTIRTNIGQRNDYTFEEAVNSVPASYRHGGLNLSFLSNENVPNSDNKYVQYRLMSNTFNTTPANWQGEDDEPTAGSENLVKSGGVRKTIFANNPVSTKGYVYGEIGGFGATGIINSQTDRARIISDGIAKVSLKGQTGLAYYIFGNNDGVGSPVTAITDGWVTSDFVNNTEYNYLFIMIKKSDNTDFTESPILYIEYSKSLPIVNVQDKLQKGSFKPVDSNAVIEGLNGENDKQTKTIERIANIASINNELTLTYSSGFYGSTGNFIESANWKHSDKFNVSYGEKLTAKVSASQYCSVISFFDSDDNFIDEAKVLGTGGTPSEQELSAIVPANAVKACVSGYTVNHDIKIYKSHDLSLNTLLVDRNVNIEGLFAYDNGFYSTVGVWNSSNSFCTSKKLNCSNIKQISAGVKTNQYMLAIAFFDIEGNILVSESIQGSATETQFNVNVPTNATFFSVSTDVTYQLNVSVVLITQYSYLEKDVLKLNHNVYEDIGIYNWEKNVGYTVTNGKYLQPAGNAADISASFCVSNFIDVTGINAIKFCGFSSNILCNCAWYSDDDESTVIESNVYPVQLSAGMNALTVFNKPEGANYARLSYKYDQFYDVEFSKTENIQQNINNRLAQNPLNRLKRMTLIIIYGQSLSIGADSDAISVNPFISYNGLMFNLGVTGTGGTLDRLIQLCERTHETPARGLVEMFTEAIENENLFYKRNDCWADKQLILSCPGVGGATIDQLTDTTYYGKVEQVITSAYNYCVDKGYELDIPVWCWLQGEQDVKNGMSASTYKTKLLALQDKVCNSIQTITGITKRPKCIIYQPSNQSLYKTGDSGVDNQFDFSYDHMGVPTAFMELARDNDEFIASAPTYILDPCPETAGYWIHCSAQSYKLLGAMLGYNIKKYLIDGVSNKGVVPTDVSISGTTIKIKYNVPCPPLSFDTDYVRKVSNMGFSVVKSDNSDIINSISLFNDTITIECTESPVGCKLRYGMNGDFIIIPNPQYPYRGVAGREHGARGNLRDNQGNYIYKDIQNIKYPLHNWAYTFEMLLNS